MPDAAVQIDTSPEVPIDQERSSLTQSQLIWRRFLRNRLAVVGGIILLVFYVSMVVFPGFFSTYDYIQREDYSMPHLSCHDGLMRRVASI